MLSRQKVLDGGPLRLPLGEHRPGGFVLWHRGVPGPGTFRGSWLDQEPGSQMCDLRKRAHPQASPLCLANGDSEVLGPTVAMRGRVAGGTGGGMRAAAHAP